MRGMKHIPVDRDAGAESFRVALEMLKDGEIVGIFPEATISRSFELKDFKSGAAAARAGRPAYLCSRPSLWGTQRLMTKGRPRDFSRGKALSVTVGDADRRARRRRSRGTSPTSCTRSMAVMLDDGHRRATRSARGTGRHVVAARAVRWNGTDPRRRRHGWIGSRPSRRRKRKSA